ncbi:MAG: small acid-soluble spore protein SspI [Bacilli bacterium]|nr:small acid-soluble spore protein SspI [Bacilli bacterium]
MKIKDYIVQNFKEDNIDTIKTAIDESVKEYDEDSLPGLGIFFMLVWENSNDKEKNTILEKIKSNLN